MRRFGPKKLENTFNEQEAPQSAPVTQHSSAVIESGQQTKSSSLTTGMATPKPKKNRVTPSIAKLEATARSEGKNLHYDTDTENKPYTSAYFKARNSPVCALSPISVMPDNDTRDERGFRLINSDDSLLSDSELSGVLAANNNITSVPQCLEDTSIWKTQTLLYVPDSPSNSQEVDLSDFSQIGNASTGRKRTLDKGECCIKGNYCYLMRTQKKRNLILRTIKVNRDSKCIGYIECFTINCRHKVLAKNYRVFE